MVLTKSEMEIMDVLWEDGGALSRSDFLDRSSEKSWKDSSVHILLNGLLRKKAIKEAGIVKRSKTYGRTFLPTLSREAYYVQVAFSRRYQPDILLILQELLNRPEMNEEILQQLKTMLEEKMK